MPGPFVASAGRFGRGGRGRAIRHRDHDASLRHAHRRQKRHCEARRRGPHRGRSHRLRGRFQPAQRRHGDRPLAGHLSAGPDRRARARADQDRRLPGRSPAALFCLQGIAWSQRGAADAAVRVDDGAHPRRRGRVLRAPRRTHRDPGRPVRRAAPHRRRALLLDHGRRRGPQLHRARSTRLRATASSSTVWMPCAKPCARKSSTAATGSRCWRVAR